MAQGNSSLGGEPSQEAVGGDRKRINAVAAIAYRERIGVSFLFHVSFPRNSRKLSSHQAAVDTRGRGACVCQARLYERNGRELGAR